MNEKKSFKIEWFDALSSTNDYAKNKRTEKQNLIVVASSQTGGRGTKGRSFSSEIGGVYLTKLTFHENMPVCRAFEIMSNAAVSVCKTLQAFGVQPKIKWPNDIFVNDKKICGILIENVFSGKYVSSSVVGIGVNVYNQLPSDLQDIATTLMQQTGKKYSVRDVAEKLIEELQLSHTMEEYLSFVGYMGGAATLLIGERSYQATLCSVDKEGGLWAIVDGQKKRFTATEISVRF